MKTWDEVAILIRFGNLLIGHYFDRYDVVVVDKNGYRELTEAQKKAVLPEA